MVQRMDMSQYQSATQWLLDATLILDGHNNSSVNLDSSANDVESEVANKDSPQGYSRRKETIVNW